MKCNKVNKGADNAFLWLPPNGKHASVDSKRHTLGLHFWRQIRPTTVLEEYTCVRPLKVEKLMSGAD
jgi:hypothetical protein